jgi:hypothetical protein
MAHTDTQTNTDAEINNAKLDTYEKINNDAKININVEIDTNTKIGVELKINTNKPIFYFPHTLGEILVDIMTT